VTPVAAEKEGGFIIVAILWILGALATLATVYSLYTSQTTLAARVNDDRLQTEASITAALELAAYQVTPVSSPSRPTSGSFALHMGRADVEAAFTTEAGRIDLNAAPKEELAGLFATLGLRKADADYDAERVIGWRTRNQEADQEEEAAAYRVAGLAYKPRRAPFQSEAELWLVLGLPPLVVEHMLPYVTVFSGRPDVDIAEASPTAIAAQPGMTPDKLQGVLDMRAGKTGLRAPAVAAPAAPTGTNKTLRVTLRIAFDNGRRVRAEAVILLIEGDEEPYHILSWQDDFDGPG
jgi:general secretion pathway protein K